jgi:DNA-binding NarL/FixJ family response regulator
MQMQITASPPRGSEYLETRSKLAKSLSENMPFKRIQIVDDTQFDADVLAGRLRKIVGRDVALEIARNLNALHKMWAEQKPDLVFLDDRLGQTGSATVHLPALRRMGFVGPIVIVSGLMLRDRRAELMRLGAFEALHKDDLDSERLIRLLLQLIEGGNAPAAPGATPA